MQQSFYTVVPSRYLGDARISDGAFRLYVLISSLCNQDGICKASNEELAKLLKVEVRTVTRYVAQLLNCGVLFMRYVQKQRELLLTDANQKPSAPNVEDYSQDELESIEELLTLWEKRLNVEFSHRRVFYPLISERLKSYTKDELKEALVNRIKYVEDSPWHQKSENLDAKNNIRIVLASDDDVGKYLTSTKTTVTKLDVVSLNKPIGNSKMLE